MPPLLKLTISFQRAGTMWCFVSSTDILFHGKEYTGDKELMSYTIHNYIW